MPWLKQGVIYRCAGATEWSVTHAQVPTALVLGDRIRLYYATRDARGRSLTSFIDVAASNPSQIIYQHDRPVMGLGAPGTHDEDGVMSGSIVIDGNDILAYYTGWSTGKSVPYRVAVGLARSSDGGATFNRVFEGPVVDRTPLEPYMTMSPYVLREGSRWHMWYGSGTRWVEVAGKMEPVYVIKHAESADGLRWRQEDITCIVPDHALEANTRPSVIQSAAGYEMWFSYRHSVDYRSGAGGYRIGYAKSADGVAWQRLADPDGLGVTDGSWDSQMIAYPNVIEVAGRRLMFYNGNGFGLSGFGYAQWHEPSE